MLTSGTLGLVISLGLVCDGKKPPSIRDGEVRVAVPDGARLRLGTLRYRLGARVSTMAISPCNGRLAAGGIDGSVAVWDIFTEECVFSAVGDGERVSDLTFSPDGRTIACASSDGEIVLWSVQERKLKGQYSAPVTQLHSLAYSVGSRLVAAGYDHERVVLVGVEQKLRVFRSDGPGDVVGFGPDGAFFAWRDRNHIVHVWDVEANAPLSVCQHPFLRDFRAACVGPRCSGYLAICDAQNRVALVANSTGRELAEWSGGPSPIRQMQFAANGRVLCSLTQAADLTWRKLPPEAGTLTLQVGTRDTQALAVSGDADFVAVDVDSAVRLCKLRGTLPISVELLSSPGHYGSVLALAFCLPATKLVTGATDGTVRFWDVCAGVQQNVLQLSESPIRALRFVPGVHVIAAAHDEQISIVRIDGAKKIQTLWGDRQIQSIAVSKDGNSMVTGELAHTVRRTWFPRETVWTAKLWRFGHFSFPLAIGKHDKDVYSVALSTDDDLIAVCGTSAVNVARQDRTIRYSGTIRVFKTRTLSEIWATRNVEGIIRCVRFCPGKRVLATAVDETPVIGENPEQSRRGKVLLWDLDRKRQLQELRVDDGALYCLDFSPDGQLLAAGGAGRKVHIWDVGTHDLVSSSTGHLGAVRSVAFAPDGRLLASGSDDSTVLLWDVSKMQSSGL